MTGAVTVKLFKHLLLALALLPAMCIAQVQVLGFDLGASTQQQVRSKLGKQAQISDAGTNKFTGGPQFKTDGEGYGIAGLTEVFYIFDKDQKLAGVLMQMGKGRFAEVFGFLAGKYKVTAQERPFVGNQFGRFKAKGATIELIAPHLGFEMQANYICDDLYAQFKTQSAEEATQIKASEKSKF